MFSVNASYAVNGDVKAVHSSELWFDNVVGRKVSTLVKAMLEERPIDDPHATFAVFRRLASLRNSATNKYGWSACDIDDMLSPHCEYRVEFEVQPTEQRRPWYLRSTPPITDTDSSCETCGRDLSVPFSEDDDALSAAATDATYLVRLKTLQPTGTRPKEFDRLRSPKHEFDRVYELGAKSTAIIAGEARFWDGVMWASAISDGTSLSAENRRCLRKYAEKIQKIEAKYKAARRLVEDVIITLTTERESL